MRTTLTIRDDLLAELKRVAAAERRPFRAVVEECLRLGLDRRDARLADAGAGYTVEPHPSGLAAGIDPEHLNRVADELDDEAHGLG